MIYINIYQSNHLRSVLKDQAATVAVDYNRAIFIDRSAQQLFGQFVQDILLDDTLYRTGTKLRVEPFVRDKRQSRVCKFQGYAILSQHLLHAIQLKGNDLADLFFVERSKHDDVIDTVQELWANCLLQ